MSRDEAKRAVFSCDGAEVPTRYRGRAWGAPIPITSDGIEAASLTLRIEELRGKLLGRLKPRSQDLFRIAAFAWYADESIPRQGVDVHRDRWRRQIVVCVRVLDPNFWSRADVSRALCDALNFATDDAWSFAFEQLTEEPRIEQLVLNERTYYGDPDSVLLFSGGMDSLCALVEAVADRGLRPVLVSHRAAPHIDAQQRRLREAFEQRFPHADLAALSFWVHRRQHRAPDLSQRSRAFLFAALGTAIAGQLGIDRVILADNGYVSINPPISGQLVGALASRGTHPEFLFRFNRLAALLFESPIVVENPLLDRTRAEALQILIRHQASGLMVETRSCGRHEGRTVHQPHCGVCTQCVDRRFAVERAGLAHLESGDRYVVDLFGGALPSSNHQVVPLSFVDFARKTLGRSRDDLFGAIPDLMNALVYDGTDLGLQGEVIAAVLRRHANDVVEVVSAQYRQEHQRLATGSLPPRNLLRLLASPFSDDRQEVALVADVPDQKTTPPNQFIRERSVCRIIFEGDESVHKHTKGLSQLGLLLQHPNHKLDPTGLDLGIARDAKGVKAPEALMHVVGKDYDPQLDAIYIDNLIAEEGDLRARIDAARAIGNRTHVSALQKQLRAVDRLHKSSTGLHGKSRSMDTTFERARKNVSNNVRRSYAEIRRGSPTLLKYLEKCVRLGDEPIFQPERDEVWVVKI